MRSLSGSFDPALTVLHPLALILAALAPLVWGVAGLTLGLTLLVPRILVLALRVLVPLALAVLELAPLAPAVGVMGLFNHFRPSVPEWLRDELGLDHGPLEGVPRSGL